MDELSEDDYFAESQESSPQTQGKRKANNQSKKKAKKQKKELYKQPTTEELNQLRETENLFNSNLFRLQIKELLTETQIKQKYKNQFQQWYGQFENVINSLPELKELSVSELCDNAERKIKKWNFVSAKHRPNFKCDQDVSLHFLKPASCTVGGLHALNSCIGPTLNVDIFIEMQRKCFYEKDYLNNRYLMKRYYYLLYLGKEIQRANICSNISLSHFIDFDSMPVLKLVPDESPHISVKINVVPPDNFFKDSRFLPNKDNLKTPEEKMGKEGTPHYNAMLLQNIRAKANHLQVLNALQDFQNVRDGLKLLIIWLKQRQLYDVVGITDEFLLQLLAYLINRRHINKHMSSYQVVRNIWLFISKSDWKNEPISACKDVKADTFSLFKEYFDVIFLDESGCYNVTAFLNHELYLKLKHEATLAVQCLDEKNSFDCLFMRKLPFPLQYDVILRVEQFTRVETQSFPHLKATKAILNTLKTGLNKRILRLVPHFVKNELCCDLNEVAKFDLSLFIGINLDLDHAFNPLELGPSPHDPKAKDFVDFWGDLSTLRRFPDGTTCEAVYFETKTIKDRRSIVKKIIEFVAERKLKLQYKLSFDLFENMITPKGLIAPFPTHTNEECSLKVISIADELNKKLRALQLPLEIANISGNADVFSYTDLFPSIPSACKITRDSLISENADGLKYYVAPVENVIQLSLHSKWPDDLTAMRHIKTAFLLKIAELLRNQHVKTDVTREYLDVFYEGVVFRYRIYHPKEVALLKRSVNDGGLASYKDNKESVALEMELDVKPKIFGALKGIQSQHPSYGPSTQLAKRWLRSHLLDGYFIPDTVINLLNASLFLSSAPFSVPVVPQIAFLRFVKFMFETDWSVQMVVVNFNDELAKETVDEIEMNFHQYRENYPELFIVMPYDDRKSLYTKNCPTKEVLKRISVLAKQCFDAFCDNIMGNLQINVEPLFIPNREGFNVFIQLKRSRNLRNYQKLRVNKKIRLEKYDERKNVDIPVVDFNPVDLYLKDLRRCYGKFALFFHDSYGGDSIGVLWKPQALQAIDFKVSQVAGRKLDGDKMHTDFSAIINDFRILGKGIVEDVVNKTQYG